MPKPVVEFSTMAPPPCSRNNLTLSRTASSDSRSLKMMLLSWEYLEGFLHFIMENYKIWISGWIQPSLILASYIIVFLILPFLFYWTLFGSYLIWFSVVYPCPIWPLYSLAFFPFGYHCSIGPAFSNLALSYVGLKQWYFGVGDPQKK